MTLTLRHRIFLTLVPLLLLLAILGTGGVLLLYRLGNSVSAILRENYDSVIAMERLNEALERIDSSFQFALNGRDDETLRLKARRQYDESWLGYIHGLTIDQKNTTLPGQPHLIPPLDSL